MAGLKTGMGGRNNPWLDLVRAIAIVLVLLRHGQRAVGQGSLDWMKAISLNGWVGVDIFFVLSGYLIARHLLRAGIGSAEFSFGRYLAMRALRIVPSYLAVIGLILAGAFPLYAIDGDQIWLRLGYHLLFLQDYLPSDINIVFWSLGVEEKFYLLAPALIFLVLRFQSAGARTAILATCFLLPVLFRFEAYNRIETPVDYEHFFPIFRSPFHMTLEGLVAGGTIAIIQASGRLRPSKTAGMAIFIGSVAILLFWMSSHDFMASIGVADAIWQPMGLAIVAGGMTVGAVLLAEVRLPSAGWST